LRLCARTFFSSSMDSLSTRINRRSWISSASPVMGTPLNRASYHTGGCTDGQHTNVWWVCRRGPAAHAWPTSVCPRGAIRGGVHCTELAQTQEGMFGWLHGTSPWESRDALGTPNNTRATPHSQSQSQSHPYPHPHPHPHPTHLLLHPGGFARGAEAQAVGQLQLGGRTGHGLQVLHDTGDVPKGCPAARQQLLLLGHLPRPGHETLRKRNNKNNTAPHPTQGCHGAQPWHG
jgi:hypothetical protein